MQLIEKNNCVETRAKGRRKDVRVVLTLVEGDVWPSCVRFWN